MTTATRHQSYITNGDSDRAEAIRHYKSVLHTYRWLEKHIPNSPQLDSLARELRLLARKYAL